MDYEDLARIELAAGMVLVPDDELLEAGELQMSAARTGSLDATGRGGTAGTSKTRVRAPGLLQAAA